MEHLSASLLVVALWLGAAPAPKKPQCAQDTDCVLAHRCNCDCCPQLEPMTQAANRAERRHCSMVGSCGNQAKCREEKCAKPLNPAVWQAVCREGRCAAERKAPKGADAGR